MRFFLLLIIFSNVFAQNTEKKVVRIKKIKHNNYFFDSKNSKLNLEGIIIPNRKDPIHGCHYWTVHKFLQKKIRNSLITKITKDTFFLDSVDIRKILLAEGIARIDTQNNFDKEFYDLQESAFLAKKNIWKQVCYSRREKAQQQKLKNKFLQTVGFVEKIIDGNSFQFKNGPIISITNTNIPLFSNKSPAAQCFLAESKKFLEHTMLHKWVQIKDHQIHQENNPQFRVFREVHFLNSTPFTEKNIGHILIQKGYTKYLPKKKSNERLEKAQLNAYKQPLGAWSTCSPYVFGETENNAPQSENIDENKCPIKGNISGSKKNPIKTYHTILSGWYKRVIPEQCFNNEEDAKNAGFRKIK